MAKLSRVKIEVVCADADVRHIADTAKVAEIAVVKRPIGVPPYPMVRCLTEEQLLHFRGTFAPIA